MITFDILQTVFKDLKKIPFFDLNQSWIYRRFNNKSMSALDLESEDQIDIKLEDFVKAYQLDTMSDQIYGKSFKKKSLKKLRKFNPQQIKVKRIVYKNNKGVYIPYKKVTVGINSIYYVNSQLSIYIYFINAKEKVAYGTKI